VVSAAIKPDPMGLAAAATQPTEICLRDVCVRYPVLGSTPKTVLSCVNLEITAGEFVVILGETGCGKSTLLRLILGEEFPSSGFVTVDGKPVTRIDSRCGYVPQKYSLFPDRTVLGNVMYGPENGCSRVLGRLRPSYWRFRRSLKSKARTFLGRMGLRAQDMNKYPHQLSGGMQQRVAIAQALMMRPPVLLMDEAFSALDPSTRGSLQEQLHALWLETRPTVVFVTHNTSEALLLGTRLVLLSGHVEDDASKSNVVLDLEIPTACIPFARRKQSLEFQELRERVKLLAYKSSSMNREEGPVEFHKAADPQ
jgi:NitT/TauT family transport system ATP-binding protein